MVGINFIEVYMSARSRSVKTVIPRACMLRCVREKSNISRASMILTRCPLTPKSGPHSMGLEANVAQLLGSFETVDTMEWKKPQA